MRSGSISLVPMHSRLVFTSTASSIRCESMRASYGSAFGPTPRISRSLTRLPLNKFERLFLSGIARCLFFLSSGVPRLIAPYIVRGELWEQAVRELPDMAGPPLIKLSAVSIPPRLAVKELKAYLPAFWIIPSRCYSTGKLAEGVDFSVKLPLRITERSGSAKISGSLSSSIARSSRTFWKAAFKSDNCTSSSCLYSARPKFSSTDGALHHARRARKRSRLVILTPRNDQKQRWRPPPHLRCRNSSLLRRLETGPNRRPRGRQKCAFIHGTRVPRHHRSC